MKEPNRPSGKPSRPPESGGRDLPFEDERDITERVVAGLAAIGIALRAQSWEKAGEQRLNPTQGRILALLARADDAGASLAYLAERLGVSGPTASDSVSTLERKGLVKKTPHPVDRRALAIKLTRSGQAAAARVSAWPSGVLAAIDHLSETDQTVLLRTLITVLRAMEEAGAVAPARMCVTCRFFRPHVVSGADPHYCAFVQAHFGGSNLRLDCRDHDPADPATVGENWNCFQKGTA